MAACRYARIEWFSDCSNHGGAICTPAGFRSQASCQHFTRDITTWHENNGGVSVNTLNNLPRCLAAHVLTFREQCSFDRVNTNWHSGAVSHRHFATGTSLPYDARPGSPRLNTEVSHATQERAPRRSIQKLRVWALLPSRGQGNHCRHLDIGCGIAEGVEVLRVQEHH